MNQKLEEKIKEQIKNKKPKPKWYFITRNLSREMLLFVLWIILVISTGFFTNVLIDFQFNQMKISGPGQFFLSFSFFPVELLIIVSALIVIIYYLFLNIGFLYRLSRSIIIVLIFVSVFMGYFISEEIGANKALMNSILGQKVYDRQGRLFIPRREDVVVGVIRNVSNNIVEIEDFNGRVWQVLVTERTDCREVNSFSVGELIWILGEKNGHRINAQTVRSMRNQPGNSQIRGREIESPRRNSSPYGTNLN